jgi:hypothetical protein
VLSHNIDHARVANGNRRFVDASARTKARVDLVNLACQVTGILSEWRRIGPRGDEMSSSNVISTFEGAGESVFVQDVALSTSNGNNAERLEAREVTRP